jgi:hypothetical protein
VCSNCSPDIRLLSRQKVAIVPKKIDELAGHFLTELGGFQYRMSGYDRVWDIVFTDLDGKPQRVKVVLYQETSIPIPNPNGNPFSKV